MLIKPITNRSIPLALVAPFLALALSTASVATCFVLASRSAQVSITGRTTRTDDLVVDDTAKVSGWMTVCTNVTAGCIGKPSFEVQTNTGETNIYGDGGLADDTFRSLHNILKDVNAGTASQQLVQSIIGGTLDTTAGPLNTWAGEYGADATRSAGSNPLTNIALLLHAQGGQVNYAIESIAGDWYQSSATATINNAGALLTKSLSIQASGGAVDFTNASAVTLSDKLVAPIKVPGSTTVNPVIGLGTATASANEQIAIKNTVTGSSGTVNGVGIGLDTTVDGNARGGLIIHRGAGGNFGGTDAKAFWVSYGADLTANQTAGDVVIFNQETNKSILFVTGGTGTTKTPLTLKAPSAHWLADGNTPATSSCGTSPAVAGSDTAFKVTNGSGATTCTITFGTTYTSAPACTVFPEAGAAVPTCTISATAITCTVTVASAVYNWHCIGKTSGDT